MMIDMESIHVISYIWVYFIAVCLNFLSRIVWRSPGPGQRQGSGGRGGLDPHLQEPGLGHRDVRLRHHRPRRDPLQRGQEAEQVRKGGGWRRLAGVWWRRRRCLFSLVAGGRGGRPADHSFLPEISTRGGCFPGRGVDEESQ